MNIIRYGTWRSLALLIAFLLSIGAAPHAHAAGKPTPAEIIAALDMDFEALRADTRAKCEVILSSKMATRIFNAKSAGASEAELRRLAEPYIKKAIKEVDSANKKMQKLLKKANARLRSVQAQAVFYDDLDRIERRSREPFSAAIAELAFRRFLQLVFDVMGV